MTVEILTGNREVASHRYKPVGAYAGTVDRVREDVAHRIENYALGAGMDPADLWLRLKAFTAGLAVGLSVAAAVAIGCTSGLDAAHFALHTLAQVFDTVAGWAGWALHSVGRGFHVVTGGVHLYGMPWQHHALNGGVVVDLPGGRCAGVEVYGHPGIFTQCD